jgi:hypothetical protein
MQLETIKNFVLYYSVRQIKMFMFGEFKEGENRAFRKCCFALFSEVIFPSENILFLLLLGRKIIKLSVAIVFGY